MKKFLKTWWKSIVWSSLILYGTLTPTDKLPETNLMNFEFADLVVHALIFMVLYILLSWELGIVYRFPEHRKKSLVFATCVIMFGLILEFIQHFFIRTRNGNVFDFLANSFGVVLAYTFLGLVYKKYFSVKQHS